GTAARLAHARYQDGRKRVCSVLTARPPAERRAADGATTSPSTRGCAGASSAVKDEGSAQDQSAPETTMARATAKGARSDDIHFVLGVDESAADPRSVKSQARTSFGPALYESFEAVNAAGAGSAFASTHSGLAMQVVRDILAKMRPAERQAFRTAYA